MLVARLVDRPLRPLFPKGFVNEVQIIITALSTDGEMLEPLAIIAASAAVSISDIPFSGPVAGVTIGFVDGEFVVNPTAQQMEISGLNLQVAGTADNILMVEAAAHELPEDLMLDALGLAHESMTEVIDLINQMQAQVGKPKYTGYQLALPAEETQSLVREVGL